MIGQNSHFGLSYAVVLFKKDKIIMDKMTAYRDQKQRHYFYVIQRNFVGQAIK